MKNSLQDLADALSPQRCWACEVIGASPFCMLCQGALLHAEDTLLIPQKNFLGCLWVYGGPLAQAFGKAKFAGHAALMNEFMGWLFNEGFTESLKEKVKSVDPQQICWVPAHPLRRMTRGFHAAQLFAQHLAEQTGLTTLPILKSVRNDAPFSLGASTSERKKRIRHRFQLKKWPKPTKILLVDDISTTGATLGEAQKTLEEAGIEVWTLVLAQTPTH